MSDDDDDDDVPLSFDGDSGEDFVDDGAAHDEDNFDDDGCLEGEDPHDLFVTAVGFVRGDFVPDAVAAAQAEEEALCFAVATARPGPGRDQLAAALAAASAKVCDAIVAAAGGVSKAGARMRRPSRARGKKPHRREGSGADAGEDDTGRRPDTDADGDEAAQRCRPDPPLFDD